MVSSSLDSDILITVALVSAAIYRNASVFGRRLLTFKRILWIPFALKAFHTFEQDDWLIYTGPRFKLMPPEGFSNMRWKDLVFSIYYFKVWGCIELTYKRLEWKLTSSAQI